MSKAVMLSIQPKWCELIASGKKTIEVRKTRPKLETPFKCYIYATNPKSKNDLGLCLDKGDFGNLKEVWLVYKCNYEAAKMLNMQILSGKVIGEFMCYDISEYETEFYPPQKQPVYEAITEWNEENEVYEAVASNCDTYQTNFLKNTCMTLEDFREYLGVGEIPFYGWHISNLVIYSEPKELSEFSHTQEYVNKILKSLTHWECGIDDALTKPIKKPPQSWFYVEELNE